MYTLTLVFNKDCDKVLVLYHNKQKAYNFIGGKVQDLEDPMNASYRELFEETGISSKDIDLKFVRQESVVSKVGNSSTWSMFVTAGMLKHDVDLVSEKNPLQWVKLADFMKLLPEMYGYGNTLTFILEALHILQINNTVFV